MKSNKPLQVIGRTDIIDMPELGLHDVDAKIDTGAYTSSIHCSRIKLRKDSNGKEVITFTIPGSKLHEKGLHHFRVSNFEERNIRSSNGHIQKRYIIKTQIILFGRKIRAEFSLADRSSMQYPILLGRKLLQNRFIVDVSKKDLSFSVRKKKPKSPGNILFNRIEPVNRIEPESGNNLTT